MKKTLNGSARVLALLVAAMLTASPALADPPEGKGKGKGKGHDRADSSEQRRDRSRDDDRDRRDHRDGRESSSRHGTHFKDPHRAHVRDYYTHEHGRGFCPPGLAKKNNGCMPPGQAKKWHVGSPLPREVVFYELPPQLVIKIGLPPAGHRYVRVAADVLLIAVGTGMVIDAIQDLGRL